MKLNYSKRKITNFDNTFRDTHSLSNFILMLIVELVWKRFLIPRKNSMRQNRFLPPSDVCHIFCPFSAFTFYVEFWSDFCSPSLTKRHNKFYVAVKPRAFKIAKTFQGFSSENYKFDSTLLGIAI
jgi:hypothetical protein